MDLRNWIDYQTDILANDDPDKARLHLTVKEKLNTIKDSEVVDPIEDGTLTDEIEQADNYRH